ncbi:hypothetical protein [uncultured Dysgonomonas sp.]|uniref:Lipoprotein n=1 Tax=uncultured Dysgonomonas sp. TaxID=206096 RepID=A0A212IT20_9BACT|nr:hypothetical protein [uncultured Dysgonomonas sp.]SBV90363.1 conserved exported hypothetical protein [uncultured Dysgonomonas sp.]
MTKRNVILLTIAGFSFIACQNTQKPEKENTLKQAVKPTGSVLNAKDVDFTLAKNYFVNNTVTKLENPKIETQEQFDEIFGTAAHMGNDGKPTVIDFSKQNVLAVVLPETDRQTEIYPVSLQKDEKGEILLTYEVKVGQKQTYTIRPNFAVIIDKSEKGNIRLNEIKQLQ